MISYSFSNIDLSSVLLGIESENITMKNKSQKQISDAATLFAPHLFIVIHSVFCVLSSTVEQFMFDSS